MIDHWHPVAASGEVRRRPAAVELCGRKLVLFRTSSGDIGALDDACPHRRSKLSTGKVVGDRVECAYHGWTFDAAGRGESPGTPKLSARAVSYEAREAHGYVWVKPAGVAAAFPQFETDGHAPVGPFAVTAAAPLELVVDNFNELEHTGVNHTTFGFDPDRMAEVRVRTEGTDAATYMLSEGPAKAGPLVTRLFIGYRPGDWFTSDTRTFFSPVYMRIDHWWRSADGGREAPVRWRVYVFCVPLDDARTRVVVFGYVKPRAWLKAVAWPLLRAVLGYAFRAEIAADGVILGNLADYSPGLEGLKLSRFDKVMGLTRERINRIYRGQPAGRIAVA